MTFSDMLLIALFLFGLFLLALLILGSLVVAADSPAALLGTILAIVAIVGWINLYNSTDEFGTNAPEPVAHCVTVDGEQYCK